MKIRDRPDVSGSCTATHRALGPERPLDGVQRRVDAIRTALQATGLAGVPVACALCMVDADGLSLTGTLVRRGIPVLGPRGAAWLATRGPTLPAPIDRIAAMLDSSFPTST